LEQSNDDQNNQPLDDQDKALCFYTEVLGYVKKTDFSHPAELLFIHASAREWDRCARLYELEQMPPITTPRSATTLSLQG
jgi:hypothetical protein